ncbi:MAG: hypothetical protein JWO05_775 [Gemmatimonadetes bacterium]|nr:hypothetical protein [Gemmatimonadota bacterium]
MRPEGIVSRALCRRTVTTACVLLVIAPLSCFPFGGDEHSLEEPYYLAATDVGTQMTLYRRVGKDGGIGRVEPTVFAAGWDKHHVIVQRHPGGDRSRTEFYIIDRSKDAPNCGPEASVIGPFTAAEFSEARRRAGVDSTLAFTLVLKSLR